MSEALFISAQAATEEHHTPELPADVIFELFGVLPITNTIFTAWCVMLVLVLFAYFSTRNMRLVPSGFQNLWEMIVELWIGILDQTMGPRGRRFLPLIATGFIFILFSNWLGILPVVHNITIVDPEGHVVPLFRSANSDLNVTAAMAVAVILIAEVLEFRSLGVGGYVKGLVFPNFLRWLEMVTRPVSLSLRLFGNIFAGEVLVVTILGLAPFALFPFLGLELFVGIIQAIIFSMLSMVFLALATAHEHAPSDHVDPHHASDEEGHLTQGDLAVASGGQAR